MQRMLLGLLLITAISSCQEKKGYGEPVVKPASIFGSTMNYLVYNDRFVKLWDDFTPLDVSAEVITKASFLQKLRTGLYLPLRLHSNDSSVYYQLYKIPDTADAGISSAIKTYAEIDQKFFLMEGKSLPDFEFTDLKGDQFNRETIKGKTLVLKFWFINCVPCVKEMPELNKMVEKYRGRKDVLFISLAIDDAHKLKEFLKKTSFDYAVIPKQGDYMANQLGIEGYPTHLVVDGNGKIVKVVHKAKELEAVLQKFIL